MHDRQPLRWLSGVSRRRILGALAAAPLGGAMEAVPMSAQSKSGTFVLVHGAWHGGWCWKKLTPLLEDRGHRVLTPTLTGLGERAHLLSPAVDLATHLQDVTAVLESEDLREVIFVVHSYGGRVMAGL